MKIILTYEFEEGERKQFQEVVGGPRWKSLLWDFDQEVLRPVVEYEDGERADVYSEIRDKLYQLINEEGLTL